MTDFPQGFLWGSATAAHQVEGGNVNNDWWDWEHDPASGCVEPSGDAIDQRNRYAEDFALLASLGQNAHRISLEWSRIEPTEGKFSKAELAHYRRVITSLHDNGLTPFVTLQHFTLPRWFAQRGGWLGDGAVETFARYATRVAEELGDLMPWVGTINEPQILALCCYMSGSFPPGHKSNEEGIQATQVFLEANRAAYSAFKTVRPEAQVGPCLQMPPVHPSDPANEDDVNLTKFFHWLVSDAYLDDLRKGGGADFVGLQYYTKAAISAASASPLAPADPTKVETTLMGWAVTPEGFGEALRNAATAGLPVVVTENGIATSDDEQRMRYLRSHLAELAGAIDAGVDVRGYFHWSAFDNFEWAHGYRPTFGLIAVDREDDFRRTPHPSAYAYGEVCRTNDISALDRPVTGAR